MTFIEKLAKGAEAVVEAIKWPLVEASIKRQADDVVDSAEGQRLETEAKIVDLQRSLAKTTDKEVQREIFKQIVSERIELEEAEHFAEIAKTERDKLFEKVKD